MRFLVFDTETTGLPQTKHMNDDNLHLWPYIVQFSYVIYDSDLNNIIKTVDEIIKIPEEVSISEGSTQIHGITKTMTDEKGENIEIILKNFFVDLTTVDLFVGHNISFDINMLKVALLRLIENKKGNFTPRQVMVAKSNLEYLNKYKNIYCTLQKSISLCNIKVTNRYGGVYLKFPKLIELYKKLFDKEPKHLHNSLNDILVTLRCFIKLKFDTDLCIHCPIFETQMKKYDII